MTQEAVLEFPQVLEREQYLGTLRSIQRSEPRAHLSTPMWLTSLRRPGVLEVVPTENISRPGIRLVTRDFWEPAEPVLFSPPPGFCVGTTSKTPGLRRLVNHMGVLRWARSSDL